MPTLDVFTWDESRGKPEEPANIVARQIQTVLRAVTDANGLNLNVSVERGLDSALWDVMYGGVLSSDDKFPMIRLFAPPTKRETDDGLIGIAGTVCTLGIYFLYYIGNKATENVQTSFEEARNNHIRTCLNALRADRCVPFSDSSSPSGVNAEAWRFLTDEESGGRTQDDETPFKYLDATYVLTPASGFTCSRVDWPFWVKGELAYPLNPVY